MTPLTGVAQLRVVFRLLVDKIMRVMGWVLTVALASVTCSYATQPKHRAARKGSAERLKREQPISVDPATVNNPATMDPVMPDSTGSAVLRAQILLDRAHFSPGEMDARYEGNLGIAINGFQAARKLPVNGTVDTPAWQALSADKGPVLVEYTVSPVDTAGPFEKIPANMLKQAKLQTMGYQSPAEELGERFHIQPKVLEALNPGKDLGKAGETIWVPNVQRAYGQTQAARIVVSKNRRTVEAFAADGTLLAQYPATMGSLHDPLPIGNWKITEVRQNPRFFYNPKLFWDANPRDSKAKIAPGPNNPVGVVWIGLSKPHYGIHGTPEPGAIGHTESHGCIRLTNWDAEELSQMVKPGTPAILQE